MSTTVLRQRAATSRRGWVGRHRRELEGWLLLVPLGLVVGLVMIGPAVGSVYFSFTEWSGLGAAEWVGLDNYVRLLSDRAFGQAFIHNLQWLVIALIVPPSLGMLAALLLARIRRGRTILRAAVFLPMLLATVVVVGIWRGLLDGDVGLGAWLASIGIPGLDRFWLGSRDTVLYAVAFVAAWQSMGFYAVLYLAAMQSIERDLYDVARVEGANAVQTFRHVTLPGIRPTVMISLLLAFMGAILVFDYVFLLTQGGPGGASEVLGTLAYRHAFDLFEAGYGAAIGVTMSVIVGLGTLVYLALKRRGWET